MKSDATPVSPPDASKEAALPEQEWARLDKLISLSALVAGVIHEINNPNHFIALNVSLLKRVFHDALQVLDAHAQENPELTLASLPYAEMRMEVPRMLEQILIGTDRIRHIVAELRTYVNTDSPGPLRAVAVNDIVSSAVTLLEGRIRRATDDFTQDLAADLPMIFGDAPRLVQVVVNMLLNALEALTDRSQKVEVQTRHLPEQDCVEILVRDDRPLKVHEKPDGAPAPHFTTALGSDRPGLGLAVAERILADHKAELVLSTAPTRGTTACVRIPVAR